MDRLTLTMYAEQQPARAMKLWKTSESGWSVVCWCANCTSTSGDVTAFTTASDADYKDVNYCIRCHARLEFTDGPSHAGAAG